MLQSHPSISTCLTGGEDEGRVGRVEKEGTMVMLSGGWSGGDVGRGI